MESHIPVLILSLAGLVAIAMISRAMLTAWRDWLALQRAAIQSGHDAGLPPSPAALIELAALKERVRKLEAIASGVDLLP